MNKKSKNQSNKWNITKEFLVCEYREKRKSFVQISKETGIPYETLYYYKKKFNIPSYSLGSWHVGKRRSPNTEFKKGTKPWNTGTKGLVKAWNKGMELSEEYKKKVSKSTKKAMANPEVKKKVRKTQFKKGMMPWNIGKKGVYSEETIQAIRKARLKQIFPKKLTSIEVILYDILENLNISYKRHKPIGNICQADAFVKPNFVLFADGDYWHANPSIYEKPKTEAQIKNIKRDKIANKKLIKEGYVVIRLWESDLLKRKEYCQKIIKKTIKR